MKTLMVLVLAVICYGELFGTFHHLEQRIAYKLDCVVNHHPDMGDYR